MYIKQGLQKYCETAYIKNKMRVWNIDAPMEKNPYMAIILIS